MLGELNPCGGGDLIPLLKPVLLVGRRSSCDVCLRFPNVSSHHCELEWKNGYWHVRDLDSRNGIKVNGERCDSKWLMPGDVLSVSKHRFELKYTTDATAPPPEEEDVFSVGLLEKAGLVKRDVERTPISEPDADTRGRYEIGTADSDDATVDLKKPENE
jgi:pSer/pThr/pTyr-binding forkhead associated (FHA) protein